MFKLWYFILFLNRNSKFTSLIFDETTGQNQSSQDGRDHKFMCVLYELQRDKTYLLVCAPNEDWSACASAQSNQSLRRADKEILFPWLSKMRIMQVLIRLRKYAGWSESKLCAHIRRNVFWRCDTYTYKVTYREHWHWHCHGQREYQTQHCTEPLAYIHQHRPETPS